MVLRREGKIWIGILILLLELAVGILCDLIFQLLDLGLEAHIFFNNSIVGLQALLQIERL